MSFDIIFGFALFTFIRQREQANIVRPRLLAWTYCSLTCCHISIFIALPRAKLHLHSAIFILSVRLSYVKTALKFFHLLVVQLKLLTLRADCATRGHEYKLFVNYSRLNIRKHFVTERVVSVWNNLENGVIKFSSLTCFKNSLLLYDLSKYVNF